MAWHNNHHVTIELGNSAQIVVNLYEYMISII